MQAEELLRQQRLDEALKELQDQVRKNPSDSKRRIFLFQLLAVMGQWDKALTQLNVAAELDAEVLLTAAMYRTALGGRAAQEEVFAGKRAPLVFGEPMEWVAWMIQANQLLAEGKTRAAAELRRQALEAAPAVPGTIDGVAFEWLADADARLGPLLEAIVNGQYYWVPLQRVREIHLEAPQDLRDLVWASTTFIWENGGESFGFIPTRYVGSESSPDPAIRLARKTDWARQDEDLYIGLGQRMLATDQGEYSLLDVRRIVLGAAPAQPTAQEEPNG